MCFLALQPIKTRKIYEEIMDQLKEMIRGGELKPGQRLASEREMAESFNVSRSSVREALTSLAAMGILDIRPGGGTFVRQTTNADTFEPLALLLAIESNPAAQMMEVRRVIETECAALAALRANPAEIAKIESTLNDMRNADSVPAAVEFDLKFHFTIAEATHNSILLRIMNTVADLMHSTLKSDREKLYAEPEQGRQIIIQHEQILDAIKAKKPDQARHSMLLHINSIEKNILQ